MTHAVEIGVLADGIVDPIRVLVAVGIRRVYEIAAAGIVVVKVPALELAGGGVAVTSARKRRGPRD